MPLLTLQELRDAAGGLSSFSDEELAQRTYERYKGYFPDFGEYAKAVGYNPGDNFKRGMRIAGNNTLGSLAGAGAMVADSVGATGLRDRALQYAGEKSNAAMREGRRSDDVDNFSEDPGAFLSAGLGQAITYAAPSVIGGGAGVLGAARLGLSKAAGAVAGGYGANFAQESGGIYNELAEQGRYEPGRAAGYGAAAAALDTVPEVLGVGRLMKGSAGSLGRRVVGGAAKGALAEAPTEVLQTALERQGAYKELTGEDAEKDYRNAAALGALGGGAFGAVTGLKRQAAPVAPLEESPDLLNPTPPAKPIDYNIPASVRNGSSARMNLQQYGPDEGPLSPYAHDDRAGPGAPFAEADPNQGSLFGADGAPTYSSYDNGVDYSPTDLPTGPFPGPAAGLQIPGAAPIQRTLDGGYDLEVNDTPAESPAPSGDAPAQDTRTRDMFESTPSAQVQAGRQYTPMSILSQIAGITGKRRDAYTVKTAIGLSRSIGTPNAPTTFLAEEKAKLDLALKKLDKQVDGESNRWTPEEYAQKRQVIENRYKDLEAATEVANQFDRALTNAYADEGAQQAAPGATVGVAPAPPTGTEQQMRERNALQQQRDATADTDARVQGAEQQRAQGERAAILAKVLDDPETRNPVGRFTAELKRAGIRDANLTAEEADKIGKFVDAKEAFNAPVEPAPTNKAPSAPNTFDPYKPAKTAKAAPVTPAPAPKPAPAPAPAPDTAPEPAPPPPKAEKRTAPKAPARDPELIELRKRESVLRSLLECMTK